jgi:hypothetical protein
MWTRIRPDFSLPRDIRLLALVAGCLAVTQANSAGQPTGCNFNSLLSAGFITWTGDSESTEPNLTFTLSTNVTITANFTGAGFMGLSAPFVADEDRFVFRLLSDPGSAFELLTNANLAARTNLWHTALTGTNTTGHDLFTNTLRPDAGPVLCQTATAKPEPWTFAGSLPSRQNTASYPAARLSPLKPTQTPFPHFHVTIVTSR